MNRSFSAQYSPLPRGDPVAAGGNHSATEHGRHRIAAAHRWRAGWWIASLELFHLVVFGIAWLLWPMGSRAPSRMAPDPLMASYLRLHQYSERVFFDEGSFAGRNNNESFWKSLFPDGQGIVSFPQSSHLVRAQKVSRPSPLEDGRSLYQVALFHNLHCLDMVRNMLLKVQGHHSQSHHSHGLAVAATGNEDGDRDDLMGHTMHCIDWIRQALTCNADLTLDATDNYVSFGDGSPHMCRNFDAILAWTQAHRYQGSLANLDSAKIL